MKEPSTLGAGLLSIVRLADQPFAISLKIARAALRLLGGSFGIVGCRDEFLSHRLCIIVIAAELHSLLVLVNGLGAIALGVVGVAAFDARPGIDPLRLATDRIQCCLEIIEGHLPVLLF